MKLISLSALTLALVWAAGCSSAATGESAAKTDGAATPKMGEPLVKDPTTEELNAELNAKQPVGAVGEARKIDDVHPRGDGRMMLQGLKDQGAKTYLELLDLSGLTSEIATSPALTFLVPTEEAFAKIPPAELKRLRSDKEALKDLLKNHILAGYMRVADLQSTPSVATWNLRVLPIKPSGDKVTIHGATVLKAAVKVGEGLMYQIDRVLPLGEKLKAN